MRLCLIMDYRFNLFADGSIASPTTYNYEFFRDRYLSVFDSLLLFVRIDRKTGLPDASAAVVNGPGIQVFPLSDWQGAYQAFLRSKNIRDSIVKHVLPTDALIVMAPSVSSSSLISFLKRDRPFGVEVISDPRGAFDKDGFSHPLRGLIAYKTSRDLYTLCRRASAVSYVTSSYLQSKYPASGPEISFGISDVVLSADQFKEYPRPLKSPTLTPRIVAMGSLANKHKGIDILIGAMSKLQIRGRAVTASVLGEGSQRAVLEQMAQDLGVSERIKFFGHVSDRSLIVHELDESDIFVMPSRTEGLPRAMLEAMARGLPVVGSQVGGIPELLQPDEMVEANNSEALADKFEELLWDPTRMASLSADNIKVAQKYATEILDDKRRNFYDCLKRASMNG